MQDKDKERSARLTELARKRNKLAGVSTNWKQWEQFNLKKIRMEGAKFFDFMLFHCSNQDSDREGWYYQSRERIEQRLGLNRGRLDSVIRQFEEAGILEKKLKGNPARLYYRIRFDRLTQPDKLAFIYTGLSPQHERELIQFFGELVTWETDASEVESPLKVTRRTKQPNEPEAEPNQDEARQLIAELQAAYQQSRDALDPVLQNVDPTLIRSMVHLNVREQDLEPMTQALTRFTAAQILQGGQVFFDYRLLKKIDQIPPDSALHQLTLPVYSTAHHPLSTLLNPKNDFDFLRRCIRYAEA